jgi:hypothetical protein
LIKLEILPEGNRTAKEEAVDDVRSFEEWFVHKLNAGGSAFGSAPLAPSEKAIIYDYIGYKIGIDKVKG